MGFQGVEMDKKECCLRGEKKRALKRERGIKEGWDVAGRGLSQSGASECRARRRDRRIRSSCDQEHSEWQPEDLVGKGRAREADSGRGRGGG